MLGVAGGDVGEQLAWLQNIITPELKSRLRQYDVHQQACVDNGEEGYGALEADLLHAFVHRQRPRQIFQIGCGVSTAVCLRAAEEAAYRPRVICVDPFPTAFLTRARERGDIELVPTKVQDMDPGWASGLEDGDLFFVDSSHTLGPAGEVTRIVLEFLPRLRKGVHVHFHDIYFPYDYPGNVLDQALFFQPRDRPASCVPHPQSAFPDPVLARHASSRETAGTGRPVSPLFPGPVSGRRENRCGTFPVVHLCPTVR